jgi:ankyrin repeat protein
MLEPSSGLLHEELFCAAERNDVQNLRWMLVADGSAACTARREAGPDGQRHTQSPLLAACAAGAAAAVELLCAHLYHGGQPGVDPAADAELDDTPLHAAVRCGRLEVVELLLSKAGPPGLDVNAQTKDGSTAFSLACRHGHAVIAHLLHTRAADLELVTNRGATPFLIACQEGHAALAEWLATDCGADTSKAADGGFNPFYMACQNGHVEVVSVLVGLGLHRTADSNNTFGTSPFYIAAQNGHLPLLKYLVAQPDLVQELGWLHQPENNGASPFYISCEQGHVEVARFLASCNADIEAANANSSSPLFIACLKGHLKVVELLVRELHVDCERPNSNGTHNSFVRFVH